MYVKICGIRRHEDALLAAELGADAIGLLVGQRHNSPDFISADSVAYPEVFEKLVDGFVLDTINVATGQVGGTGKMHDWSVSRQIVMRYPEIAIILAGGLNSENVRSAIEYVHPFGVDVNSGTKGSDGFKDARKMREFIRGAKRLGATGR